MKKRYIFVSIILVMFLFLPFIVLAEDNIEQSTEVVNDSVQDNEKNKCIVLSGTGKNIGDEIVCDTEHFYVISNDGENIKMLAKYNLRAGSIFEKVTYDEKIDQNSTMSVYEEDEVRQKMIEGYQVYKKFFYFDSTINSYKSRGAIMEKKFDSDRTAVFFDQEFLRYVEIYNKEEIRKYLDDGYLLDKIYYSNHYASSCNSGTSICQYYINGASFYKTDGYDYVNIFFDEEVSPDDIENYLLSVSDVQEKLNDGYAIKSYYKETYYNNSYNYIGVTLEKVIEKKYGHELLQSEDAIGAHGDETGNPVPIEIGVLPSQYIWGSSIEEQLVYNTGFRDYYYDYNSAAYYYLSFYYDTLVNRGFSIIDVDSITVSEINSIVKNVTGQDIPLDDWYNNAVEAESYVSENSYYILGSLKELLPEKYSWLWGTTYWTRTSDVNFDNIYFVDTLGDLCSGSYCAISIGAGLRPVVTISTDLVIYNILTKTDGNGIVTASRITSESGQEIEFIVTPKDGYSLKKVLVTTESGETLEFTDYKFTMPSENVEIYAEFERIVNPSTGMILPIVVVVVCIVCGFVVYFAQRENKIVES